MYQVLYRKYRPKLFRDVVGQEHITDTLVNELASGRLSHAYLFTGTRGTGKTSCAKILAKAMNCLHPAEGEPCNACEVCLGIDNGTVFDVVEIDAASNNGVDNIRDLREEANFTPSVGKYRVYIIDEVHMLSTGAFNALLKTLEEPPEHVKFILATTEIHKLPATILSRCQRFDFKRISSAAMAKRLNYVAQQEGFTLADDGALLIARIADGALRDALSILDQCAGHSKIIDAHVVSAVCGIADKNYLYRLSSYISAKNTSSALALLNELHNNSCDMERLCTEMINHFRNLLVVKTVKSSRDLIISTDEEYQLLREKSTDYTTETIIFALDLFQSTLEHMKRGANRRTEMEMTFIKLCEPSLEMDAAALLSRIAAVERAVQRAGVPAAENPAVDPATDNLSSSATVPLAVQEPIEAPPAPVRRDPAPIPPAESVQPEAGFDLRDPEAARGQFPQGTVPAVQHQGAADVEAGPDQPFLHWKQVMERIFELDKPLFGILTGSRAMQRDDFILIDSPNPTIKDFIKLPAHNKAIKQAIYEVTGNNCRLGIFRRPEAIPQQTEDPLEQLARMALDSGIDVTMK